MTPTAAVLGRRTDSGDCPLRFWAWELAPLVSFWTACARSALRLEILSSLSEAPPNHSRASPKGS